MGHSIIDELTATINETIDHFASQKIIVDLWPLENPESAINASKADSIIQKFFIEGVGERNDIEDESSIFSIFSLIDSLSSSLSDEIGNILDDNENQVQECIIDALDIILGQVDGFKKSFDSRIVKFKKECERDEIPFARQKEMFEELIRKSFSSLIGETLSAIYRGIQITSNPIYDLVLQEFNTFFRNVGISTLDVKIGSKMDFEICVYADAETVKDTEDINLDDCVYEITQLPYVFANKFLVSPGKVCTWRFKK